MSERELPSLNIGEYNLDLPIIQGGMSVRISGAKLAARVAQCGGAGTIGGVGRGFGSREYQHLSPLEADRQALQKELRKAEEINPHGIHGVNLLVAVTDFKGLVRTAVDAGAKFIVAGAGLPTELPALTVGHPEVALVPIVSSLQALRIICKKWKGKYDRLPDAFIIEEPFTAGGHLGVTPKQDIEDPNLRLDVVLPECLRYLESSNYKIPLVAAGGIWDRPDIDHMLALGASGVQMATRFVCTPECEAPDSFKQKYIDSNLDDIVIIESPVGIPGRAIRTKFIDKVERGEISDICRVSCLKNCSFRDSGDKYCIMQALKNVRDGNPEKGVVFAGSNAPRSKEIVPVRQIFDELTA